MKDLPHHMKKLNRRIVRSMRREEHEAEILPEIPTWPETERQKKKKAKVRMRNETNDRPPTKKDPEERNRTMKTGRVPIFDREKAAPKHAAPSKKKTPRI